MTSISLASHQAAIKNLSAQTTLFLDGPAGSGKTTAAVARLLHLLEQGIPASSILVLVPQRTLAAPYLDALRDPSLRAGGTVTVLTAGGLARRMVELFWPLVAEPAGFGQPQQPPTFLTLETAQYHMARLVRPLREEQGYFESISISPNRLYSQIIDNLNKAAVVGFPYGEIGERLRAAWMGEPAQARVYVDAQHCVTLFRDYCLQHNLLDFSLQVEVFWHHLWPLPVCRDHLLRTYRHLIADNLEEDTPFAHDLLREWLPHLDSALLIVDQDAGYRRFLGADPPGAYELRDLCQERISFTESIVTPGNLQALSLYLAQALEQPLPRAPQNLEEQDVRAGLTYNLHRFYPEMLDWVAGQIAGLVEEGVSAGQIVVLAPFLSDALRFSLMNRLERLGVPARSHRPSRALREEPATRCLLTLAALAHPHWGILPGRFDFATTLVQAIAEMDPVRAQLLAQIVYRPREGQPTLTSFDRINPDMHERITYVLGGRYEGLRIWLADYARRPEAPLDHFLSRLFGEVLSQPGYGFHANYDAGQIAANLVESVQKFRWGVVEEAERAPAEESTDGHSPPAPRRSLGQEYLEMVRDGVIAAQYIRGWRGMDGPGEEAVLLTPAHTFLMSNRPVDYQFWLDVGSRGWFERLYQPLTHPYVLSRHWEGKRAWSDADEFTTSRERLYRLVLGLIRRCRKRIYLGLSELGEQGYEHRGPLLMALNQVLQRVPVDDRAGDDPGHI